MGEQKRQIKFRAWDKRFGRMIHGTPMAILYLDDPDHEIMQFTGLRDKNGVEIYEGDIVLWGNHIPSVCKVVFDAPSFVLEEHTQEADRFNRYDHRDIEVVGNVYQNLELLK